MSYQGYRSKTDRTTNQNESTKRPVHPARPELDVKPGGENLTPSPQALAGTDNPGVNRYCGPSSIQPGTKAMPASINAQAPKDVLLDNIIAVGTAHTAKRGALNDGDNWQTRELAPDNVPVHDSMHANNGSPSGKVPAKTGSRSDQQ
ncbi:MAG: hypothetical protein ACRECV_02085 [Xanthobacteraceae bacterium]